MINNLNKLITILPYLLSVMSIFIVLFTVFSFLKIRKKSNNEYLKEKELRRLKK